LSCSARSALAKPCSKSELGASGIKFARTGDWPVPQASAIHNWQAVQPLPKGGNWVLPSAESCGLTAANGQSTNIGICEIVCAATCAVTAPFEDAEALAALSASCSCRVAMSIAITSLDQLRIGSKAIMRIRIRWRMVSGDFRPVKFQVGQGRNISSNASCSRMRPA
jgi:hypothetical protein